MRARVADDLHVGSDHAVLRIEISGGESAIYGRPGRFRLDTLDQDQYLHALEDMAPTVQRAVDTAETAASPGRSRSLG